MLPPKFYNAWILLLKLHFMYKFRPFVRIEIKEWEELAVRSQEALVAAFKSETHPNGSKFSVKFIYTHIIREHFPACILFLGPAPLQSTQFWEKMHQYLKGFADKASKKNFYLSVMNIVTPFIPYYFANLLFSMTTIFPGLMFK